MATSISFSIYKEQLSYIEYAVNALTYSIGLAPSKQLWFVRIQSNLLIADRCETLSYCPLLGGVRYREEKLLQKSIAKWPNVVISSVR